MSARFPYSPARFPPIPAVIVTLRAPDGSRAIPDVPAHIDTAADRTLVPLTLVQQLGLQPVARVTVHSLGSVTQQIDVYPIDVEIPGVAVISTRSLTHADEPFVLLGRDIVNLFRITFDGPNQAVEFH